MDKFNYPVMVFHGEMDNICSYKESKKFVERKITPYRRLHLFKKGYHELQHDEEKDELLEKSIKFFESLPETMKRSVGNIVYANLAFKTKPRVRFLRNFSKIAILLGILFFLYRRFFKKA